MSTILENLNWRYATKRFDATKKISDADLNTLKEAVSNVNNKFKNINVKLKMR